MKSESDSPSREFEIPRHFELSGWRGYGSAVILVALGRLVSTAFPANPAAPYYLSILLASLWGGRGPGILAAILSAVATAFYDLGTDGGFDLGPADLPRLVIFFILAIITSELVVSRRRTEESLREVVGELETLDRAKDEFIATITHDLRSPLTSILGWAALLKERVDPEDDETKTALNSIIRSARIQSRLVDDLLEASRVRVGKIHMRRERFDLVELVDEVFRSFTLEGDRQGVQLRRNVDESAIELDGDPGRIEQLLRNLVSNALKFTPHGGAVEVSLTSQPEWVRLEVRDTGSGISSDVLPVVFEQFAQAPGSREKGGLGLGLAIVRHIAELHGGRVEARSEGEGKGATFIVELPREKGNVGN
ncbi:MAG: DUF4118 domain-containing protein [Acidobacteria bacterium]|nr:DUF4118 domain-containing protein [Acidobacteriota bacterium]